MIGTKWESSMLGFKTNLPFSDDEDGNKGDNYDGSDDSSDQPCYDVCGGLGRLFIL